MVQEKHSEDDISWTGWAGISGAITVRYLKLRCNFATTDDEKNIILGSLSLDIDVPDLTERIFNKTIDIGGTVVNFTKDFHTNDLVVIITSIDNNYIPMVTSTTKDSCTVHLKDNAGDAKAGNANILVEGY